MDFKISKDIVTGVINFSGSITPDDLQRLRLDHVDLQVIDSPAETVADHLQSLEIIFRRAQQQEAEKP